jgi:hypothetical protein
LKVEQEMRISWCFDALFQRPWLINFEEEGGVQLASRDRKHWTTLSLSFSFSPHKLCPPPPEEKIKSVKLDVDEWQPPKTDVVAARVITPIMRLVGERKATLGKNVTMPSLKRPLVSSSPLSLTGDIRPREKEAFPWAQSVC